MTDFCKNIIGLLTQGTHDDMLIIYLFSTMTFHKCFFHVKTFEITLKKMIRKLFFRLNLKSYQFKQSIQFHTYFSCTYHVRKTKQNSSIILQYHCNSSSVVQRAVCKVLKSKHQAIQMMFMKI